MFYNEPLVTFNQEEKTSPLARTAKIAAGGAAFVGAHRLLMSKVPGFAGKAYNFFHQLEERSPGRIFRTFGLGELYSSYLPSELSIPHASLFTGAELSGMGQHLQRMLGEHYDLRTLATDQSLKFTRTKSGSAYMKMQGAEDIQIRFFKAERTGSKLSAGKLAGASQRLGAPLEKAPFSWLHPETLKLGGILPKGTVEKRSGFQWFKSLVRNIGTAQHPATLYPEVLEGDYLPGIARIAGKPVRNFAKTAELVSFEMGERAQVLLSDIRLGVWKGTYNRLFHVPFFGGENRGLVNELLTKRALPIYGLTVGLGYADYLTHHVVSNGLINLYQKARVAHANLTDAIPGARKVTDKYEQIVPGAQYGPLALPIAGATVGGLIHYSKVVTGKLLDPKLRSASARIFASAKAEDPVLLKFFNRKSPIAKGLIAGVAALLPFIPGMLGSRSNAGELRNIYSGNEPVAVRAGRWWDLGTTPWEGNRIKEYKPHWSVLRRTHAEDAALYGSEKEKWAHNPLIHPLRWLRDPYYLERKHYQDRPYPITSPAFSDVPLIGPLLAGTIGKIVKPPVRLHPEWNTTDYNIGSSRLQPRGPDALPPATPKVEFGLKDTTKREILQFSELVGLPGFIARTLYDNAYKDTESPKKNVYLQGSRQMTSVSRRYYEKELGAGLGPNAEITRTLGYTEPLRRFIQPEPNRIEVNEIPNTMPSWLPGENYFLNFRVGDPYTKIPEGYARLPGEGYEAIHPELAGLKAEDYPDIAKMSILGDVAPYSVEYRRQEARVRRFVNTNPELKIEYEKVRERVRVMKESVVRTDDRRFSKEITKATGTVSRISGAGIELQEFPGRKFSLSSVGYTAADQSAIVLGEHNNWSKAQVASEVSNRQSRLVDFFNNYLKPGTEVNLTTPLGALDNQEDIQAVFNVGDVNINKALMNEGLAQYRKDLGGPEAQAMFGWFGRTAGSIAENVSFTGDESRLNPLRYIPTPYHTKLWQERTPLAQYEMQEVEGARLRRWQHPVEDFLMPYARGVYRRVVGDLEPPKITQKKRDLNTLSDMLEYIRDMKIASTSPEHRGRYTSQASRTAIGSDLFGSPTFVASTMSGRDSSYFTRFLKESDPAERSKILASVPTEMKRALATQWVAKQADIARASGERVPKLGDAGRLYTDEGLEQYSKSDTKLNYGDYQRSQEIAEFFTTNGLALPDDASSQLYDPSIDYEDVKLKIVQQEGYDTHDFGLFDDRAALLWRKPYIDGAVRELTSTDQRSTEQVRQSVERMILAAHDKNPQVMLLSSVASRDRGNVRVDVDLDQQKQLLQDIRRNAEQYQ